MAKKMSKRSSSAMAKKRSRRRSSAAKKSKAGEGQTKVSVRHQQKMLKVNRGIKVMLSFWFIKDFEVDLIIQTRTYVMCW